MRMNRKAILHDTFRVGITMKGFDGVLETIGGVLLWFISPASLGSTLQTICMHELSRNPHDFIVRHLLHLSIRLAHSQAFFASLFLLSHGVVKVVLAIALWLDELWAYPVAIAVFGGFGVYQVYRYTHSHSMTLFVLTVFDVIVIALTWWEYRAQLSLREARNAA